LRRIEKDVRERKEREAEIGGATSEVPRMAVAYSDNSGFSREDGEVYGYEYAPRIN
jgi:hypothetical protein